MRHWPLEQTALHSAHTSTTLGMSNPAPKGTDSRSGSGMPEGEPRGLVLGEGLGVPNEVGGFVDEALDTVYGLT